MNRTLWIVVAAVVLGGGVLIMLLGDQVATDINGLDSDSPAERRAKHKRLVSYKIGDKAVDAEILEAVWDQDNSWRVRRQCAQILIERQQRSALERSLRETKELGKLPPILDRLSNEEYFKRTYAEDPAYRVNELLDWWMAQDGDDTRSYAIRIATKLGRRDLLPKIRPLLKRRPTSTHAGRESQKLLLIAAAGAAQFFKDCESIDDLVTLTKSDPDPLVRMRAMQFLSRLAVREGSACESSYGVPGFRELVQGMLDDPEKPVRMAALIEIDQVPSLGEGLNEKLYDILESDKDGSERRYALHALSRMGDPDLASRMGRYAHDRSAEVRSSNVAKATLYSPPLFSIMIGAVRDEAENKLAFETALDVLREKGGSWHGFPPDLAKLAQKQEKAWIDARRTLFEAGEFGGVTRRSVADAWFSWFVEDMGLSAEEQAAAVEARTAFWAAAEKGDAAAAKAALDKLPQQDTQIFLYERGWLEARS